MFENKDFKNLLDQAKSKAKLITLDGNKKPSNVINKEKKVLKFTINEKDNNYIVSLKSLINDKQITLEDISKVVGSNAYNLYYSLEKKGQLLFDRLDLWCEILGVNCELNFRDLEDIKFEGDNIIKFSDNPEDNKYVVALKNKINSKKITMEHLRNILGVNNSYNKYYSLEKHSQCSFKTIDLWCEILHCECNLIFKEK